MTYVQGECSYRHAGEGEEVFDVGRVLLLNDLPASLASVRCSPLFVVTVTAPAGVTTRRSLVSYAAEDALYSCCWTLT
jgi:hypothetical protein